MKNRLHRILCLAGVGGSLALSGFTQNASTPRRPIAFSRNPYAGSTVAAVEYGNSLRLKSLLRNGRLYLSLDDVIALALENNLDIELQRFTPQVAAMDLLRAQGGGTLRGLPLSLRVLPSGVGGPASPLLTNLGGGSSSTLVQGTLADLAVLSPQETSLSIQGSIAASSGPAVPKFDPALQGQLNWSHQEAPQTDLSKSGTYDLITETALGGLGIQQGLASGASWNAGYSLSRINFNSIQSSFDPYLSGSLGLAVTQPLLQGFGTGLNRRFIRIANNNKNISELVFRQQLISTVSDAIRLYWDLVSLTEDLSVKQSAVTLARKLVEEDQIQVETGTLPPLQLKRSQAELARTQQDFVNAQNLLLEQELVLKNVLTRNGGADAELASAHIQPLDRIQVPMRFEKPTAEEMVSKALANRPDLKSARLQLENSKIALQGAKNALLPNLALVAGVQTNSEAGQANPWASAGRYYDPDLIGGFGTANSQLFTGTFPNYQVGIQLSIPLRNRVAQADYARDQIQMRQTDVRLHMLENQARLEVQNALLSLERAHAACVAAVQTRQLQEEALAAEQERYTVGASTSFYIIQYERDVTQARSTEVAAQGAYAKAKTALDRVLGETLENNHISMAEALTGEVSAPPTPLPAAPPSK